MKPINSLFGFTLFSLGGGVCLATVIASYLFNAPLVLSHALDLMLYVARGQSGPVPGGMSLMGLICLLVTSTFSVAIVLWLVQSVVRGAQEGSGPWRPARMLAEQPAPVLVSRTEHRRHLPRR